MCCRLWESWCLVSAEFLLTYTVTSVCVCVLVCGQQQVCSQSDAVKWQQLHVFFNIGRYQIQSHLVVLFLTKQLHHILTSWPPHFPKHIITTMDSVQTIQRLLKGQNDFLWLFCHLLFSKFVSLYSSLFGVLKLKNKMHNMSIECIDLIILW